MKADLVGGAVLAAGYSAATPLVPVIVLAAAGVVGYLVLRSRRQKGQWLRPSDVAERYREAGMHYTPPATGLGEGTDRLLDRVDGVRHGYPFRAYRELRVLRHDWSYNYTTDRPAHDTLRQSYCRIAVALARPTPLLRIWHRVAAEDDPHRAIVVDGNAGAVATGVSHFDDRFLVFCDDLPFIRHVMTPELVAWIMDHPASSEYAQGSDTRNGIELRGGELAVEESGAQLSPDRIFPAVDYLVGLMAQLPAELRPAPRPVPGQQGAGR